MRIPFPPRNLAGSRHTVLALRVIAAAVLTVLATAGLGLSVADAAANAVSFSAVVNSQPADTSSDARPAQLYPDKLAEVEITVSNSGTSTVQVATVRLQGEVMDLPLFSYDSAVDLVVMPGHTKSLTFPISLSGVGSQATGLVVASLTLLGPGGAAIGSQSLVTNVHGSLQSLYGVFGLVVLVLTASSLLLALVAMARHTLPQNRWVRAVRFLIPGFGIGLVLIFTSAAFGVFAPGPGHWLPLLVVTSVTGLAVGYLTPAPNEEELDDYDDDVLLAQIVVVDEDPLDSTVTSRPTGVVSPSRATAAVPDSRATTAP